MSDLIYDPMTWLAGAGSIIVLVGYLFSLFGLLYD